MAGGGGGGITVDFNQIVIEVFEKEKMTTVNTPPITLKHKFEDSS
jgi:hypothetical protein